MTEKELRKWRHSPEKQLLFELSVAYYEARRGGKRKSFDEHKFEAREMENLLNLRDSIINKTYRPSRGTAHVIHNPVIREIFAAPFRDRIVHHWIYDTVYKWWDRRFIVDSYSCREGKGTKFGVERLAHHIQSASDNYKKEVYVAKMDIMGFFMNLPRKGLYERAIWGLDRQFEGKYERKYELLKFCWRKIIFDNPCENVYRKGWPNDWRDLPDSKSLFKQPKGRGIVIGNLTSQLLSNIYLDQLDRYVTFDLGYKHYGRYVDDFYIVVTKDQLPKLKEDIHLISNYLKRLGLTMHPKKFFIQPASRGTPFLGGIVYPGCIQPGHRLKKNAKRAFYEVATGQRDLDSVASYLGHLKYFASKKFIKERFDELGWRYRK